MPFIARTEKNDFLELRGFNFIILYNVLCFGRMKLRFATYINRMMKLKLNIYYNFRLQIVIRVVMTLEEMYIL